jgi:hypothetical protein
MPDGKLLVASCQQLLAMMPVSKEVPVPDFQCKDHSQIAKVTFGG